MAKQALFQHNHTYQIIFNKFIFEKTANFSDANDPDSDYILKFGEKDSSGKYNMQWDSTVNDTIYYPFYFEEFVSEWHDILIRDLTDGGNIIRRMSKGSPDQYGVINESIVLKLNSTITPGDTYIINIDGNEYAYTAYEDYSWVPLDNSEIFSINSLSPDSISISGITNTHHDTVQKNIQVYHKETKIQTIDPKFTRFPIEPFRFNDGTSLEWGKRHCIQIPRWNTTLNLQSPPSFDIEHEVHIYIDDSEGLNFTIRVPGCFWTPEGSGIFTISYLSNDYFDVTIKYIGIVEETPIFTITVDTYSIP